MPEAKYSGIIRQFVYKVDINPIVLLYVFLN